MSNFAWSVPVLLLGVLAKVLLPFCVTLSRGCFIAESAPNIRSRV